MIINKTPLRISFFGGSTDHPNFIKKYKKSKVINLSINLFTYSLIFADKFGYNSHLKKYILHYSKIELVKNIKFINNDVIRECLNICNAPPVSIYLASDIFSYGSGLASSCSYILSLLKCIHTFKNIKISNYNLLKKALFVERKFNKFCGYQDVFGCGIPGFKIISTTDDHNYNVKKLNTDIFKEYNLYLFPTLITRNSREILENGTNYLHLIDPIYEIAQEAEKLILKKEYLKFLRLMKISWDLKKMSNPHIMNNNNLIKIDNMLEKDKDIISHKLLGAGSGGNFLLISKKKNLIQRYKNCIRLFNGK